MRSFFRWVIFFFSLCEPLSSTQPGSVTVVGTLAPLAPYICTVNPGVGVRSSRLPSAWVRAD